MLIIGCDLHTRYQVIAMLNRETGRVSLDNDDAVIDAATGKDTGYRRWLSHRDL